MHVLIGPYVASANFSYRRSLALLRLGLHSSLSNDASHTTLHVSSGKSVNSFRPLRWKSRAGRVCSDGTSLSHLSPSHYMPSRSSHSTSGLPIYSVQAKRAGLVLEIAWACLRQLRSVCSIRLLRSAPTRICRPLCGRTAFG